MRTDACPRCGRSRGSMAHKTKCLGKSRSEERSKNRERRARAHIGRVSWRAWSGSVSGVSVSSSTSAPVAGVVMSANFFADRAADRGDVAQTQAQDGAV